MASHAFSSSGQMKTQVFMTSSASSSPPQTDARLNFNDHPPQEHLSLALVSSSSSRQLKHQPSLSFGDEDTFMAPSSSSPAREMKKYHVFLSFRGEDTRLNFATHLLEALKKTGMDVFFDEEKLERGEELSPALSQAIEASSLSVIILSEDYASSKSCLAELSDIMDRKLTQGQVVLPIFYNVDPSDVQNISGSFKISFQNHRSNRSLHEEEEEEEEVKRWETAFVQVRTLKGIHIKGDKPETEHIKDIVEYVIQKLMKHQVFLSFRGRDTGLKFTAHLLEALEKRGINVFSDEGEKFYQAISVSSLSIIVLSVNYASSKSCLAELSEIMRRKDNQGQIVLPIFYCWNHELNGLTQVQQWRKTFARVGKLKGWHIEGGKFDRSDAEYIKDVIEYAIKMLNRKSRSASEEFVGIDDQKKVILGLIEKEDSRV
ncbi:hypothetical protein V6N13_038456 [Hibiscus sabdariffa]